MNEFKLVAPYTPQGDQPQAIQELVEGLNKGVKEQTLLGATGTGKTFTIANVIKEEINYLLVLNDNGADGIDISWIWDTDFDILNGQKIKNIVCSGKRAKELALRLKYTGIEANIVVLESIPEAVDKLKSYNEKYAIAIPNYTALVETQRELEK